MPEDPEKRRLRNARYYENHKSEELRGNQEPERIRTKQDSINELLEQKREYEEHIGYREAFDPIHPHNINDLLNPKPMRKGMSDSPQSYGEAGIVCCSICGGNLDKNGRCARCNPEQQSSEVAYQQALSQSNHEMNAEQFEQQNQPKPPKAGENPDVDSWLKTH